MVLDKPQNKPEPKAYKFQNKIELVSKRDLRTISSIRLLTFYLYLNLFLSGENVEEAFLEAAKRIYQNIQDGSLDLNAAESGVQHKPSAPQGGRLNADSQPAKEGCSC